VGISERDADGYARGGLLGQGADEVGPLDEELTGGRAD